MPHHHHILIIGGGIVGLTLAQALRKQHPTVRCTVYERDASPSSRGAGWGLTIHWALATFLELVPGDISARLEEETYVDAEASRAGDGNFLLYDLRSGQERYRVPPNRRIRVRREALRRLLMEGVSIEWSKTLSSITTTTAQDGSADDGNGSVTAHFTDGTSAVGTLLIGCDGTRSRVRQALCPASYENTKLPVRLLGVSVVYPAAQAEKMRALDPFFLQGGDPLTDTYFWFSFLDTPSSHPEKPGEYTCQILTSWPYRPGFLGRSDPIDIPASNADRIAFMKTLAAGWAEPFRSVVLDIPPHAEPTAISLEDWPPPRRSQHWRQGKRDVEAEKEKGEEGRTVWERATGGRVTLAGDAAHAMVMFRGEAANHGIIDISVLLSLLSPYLSATFDPDVNHDHAHDHDPSATTGSSSAAQDHHCHQPPRLPQQQQRQQQQERQQLASLIAAYEAEMVARTRPAVLTSRRACLDAHDYKRINESSPLVSRRAAAAVVDLGGLE